MFTILRRGILKARNVNNTVKLNVVYADPFQIKLLLHMRSMPIHLITMRHIDKGLSKEHFAIYVAFSIDK